MNELLLILAFFIVIILIQNYFVKISSNSASFIRLISGIVFLPFISFSADADALPIKILLTVVLLSAIYKAVINYSKEKFEIKNPVNKFIQ